MSQIISPIHAAQYILASTALAAFDEYSFTPRNVPSVLVMTSVVSEYRVGRYDCRTSIVRLTANPSATVARAACRMRRTDVQWAQKTKPRGTKPAIFTRTSLK